jgi:multidrug resistance efflux pump
MKNRFSQFLGWTLLVSIILAGCGAAQDGTTPATQSAPILPLDDSLLTSSAEVVAEKWARLAFMVGAQRVDVHVKVGDRVKQGDLLASLPENALPQSIINAEADLVLAQQSLDDLLTSETALAQATIQLRAAQDAYDKAADYRDSLNEPITFTEVKIKEERTPGGIIEIPVTKKYKANATEKMIAKADEDLELKKSLLEDARRTLDRLANVGDSPEAKAARTRIAAIEAVLNQSKLIAPFDGVVVETYLNSGEMISPGAPVVLLADLSTLQVRTTDLNEVDAARVQIGDPVSVTFDALPDTIVPGEVANIALKNAPGSGVYFNVVVKLEEIPEPLRWGMSAFVEIQATK